MEEGERERERERENVIVYKCERVIEIVCVLLERERER